MDILNGPTRPSDAWYGTHQLYKAVRHGDTIRVRRLLSEGADPNEAWGGVHTILSVAAILGH